MAQRRPEARIVPSFRRRAARTGKRLAAGLAALLPAGCGVIPFTHVRTVQATILDRPTLTGYVGTVVADEPQAALAGQEILAHGGNAADAATAVALTLSVTLPSRASLGGGGACLAARPHEAPRSFLFLPVAGGSGGTAPDARPASVPMVPRGLFTMQSEYGSIDFGETVIPATILARQGTTVSRALGADLAAVHSALFANEDARAQFARADESPLRDGDMLTQPDLANFLDRLARAGVGDLYNGALADIYLESATEAGAGLDKASMRNALPGEGPALRVAQGASIAYFTPPPADGGFGAAAQLHDGANAEGAVAAWRAAHPQGGNGTGLIEAAQAALDGGVRSGGSLPPLPASTSFVVTDQTGGAVACALTDGNLFGTGRIAAGTGVVLGASPARTPLPMLGSVIVQTGGTLTGAAASSGQNGAASALADAARAILAGTSVPHEGSGRANAAICRGKDSACVGETDPRGAGLATGATK